MESQVCNHPELFERNEGITYFFFGEVPNSLLPPPYGELEEIYYSGRRNPITYEVINDALLIYSWFIHLASLPSSRVFGFGFPMHNLALGMILVVVPIKKQNISRILDGHSF